MARTPQRHVMDQSACLGTKPENLDGLGTQKRHACRIRFCPYTSVSEVVAQMCAGPVQDLCHCAVTAPWGATGIVRLAPESASKTASFVVSKASSSACPKAALESAGTLATNS